MIVFLSILIGATLLLDFFLPLHLKCKLRNFTNILHPSECSLFCTKTVRKKKSHNWQMSDTVVSGRCDNHDEHCQINTHSLPASGSVSAPHGWDAPFQSMGPAESELLKWFLSACESQLLWPLSSPSLCCYFALCPFLAPGLGQDRSSAAPPPPFRSSCGWRSVGVCL